MERRRFFNSNIKKSPFQGAEYQEYKPPIATYVFIDITEWDQFGHPKPQMCLAAMRSDELRRIKDETARQKYIDSSDQNLCVFRHSLNPQASSNRDALIDFIRNLEKPVCLIDYNGLNAIYTHLFQSSRSSLLSALDEAFGTLGCLKYANGLVCFCHILDPHVKKTTIIKVQMGELPWLESYSLENVYNRVMGGRDRIWLTDSVKAMVQISVKLSENFPNWVDNNYCSLSTMILWASKRKFKNAISPTTAGKSSVNRQGLNSQEVRGVPQKKSTVVEPTARSAMDQNSCSSASGRAQNHGTSMRHEQRSPENPSSSEDATRLPSFDIPPCDLTVAVFREDGLDIDEALAKLTRKKLSELILAELKLSKEGPQFSPSELVEGYIRMRPASMKSKMWLLSRNFGVLGGHRIVLKDLIANVQVWIPGTPEDVSREAVDLIRGQNWDKPELELGKWILVKRVASPTGTHLYFSVPTTVEGAWGMRERTLFLEDTTVHAALIVK